MNFANGVGVAQYVAGISISLSSVASHFTN